MKNRIVRFNNHGGPEVLKLVNEDIKEPKDDEVRINVKAILSGPPETPITI